MIDETHPVVTCEEAVALEKGLLQGDPELEWRAMKRAGAALGQALLKDYREIAEWPLRPRLLILAGKGHNAGDAFLAVQEVLRARPGASIDVFFAMGEEALNPLARRAWSGLLSAGGKEASIYPFSVDRRREVLAQLAEKCGGRYQVCLDGLFGMNFRPPFRAPIGEVIGWLNERLDADLRAAVDLPSGLSDEPSELAFRADFSYMTGSAKRPLFARRNAKWAGRLRYLDIGFFTGGERAGSAEGERVTEGGGVLLPAVLNPLRQLRGPMMHKRKFGHLLIVGGSRLMPGAILMSIMAAARSGVGLLTAAVPASLVPAFATVVPEAMWIGCEETEAGGLSPHGLQRIEPVLDKATAMLIGPGVGTEAATQTFLEELVRRGGLPLVIDAEALQPPVIAGLRPPGKVRGRVGITPHAGEFARISGRDFAEEGEEALLEFCRESGLVVLLKGPPFTRVCEGDRIAYVLPGGPVLARGGSGDILAGIAGSLVAREPDQVAGALRRAALWHGLAAEAWARELGQEAVRTTQLLDFLPGVLREGFGETVRPEPRIPGP